MGCDENKSAFFLFYKTLQKQKIVLACLISDYIFLSVQRKQQLSRISPCKLPFEELPSGEPQLTKLIPLS